MTPKPDDSKPVAELTLLLTNNRAPSATLQKAVDNAAALAESVCFTRDLVNEPSSLKPPEKMGEIALGLAKKGRVTVKVLHKAELEKLGMGGILRVGAGSHQPPCLVHLTYTPAGKSRKTVVVIGKGITFDSGGISLKTSEGMETMKGDMAGAAAVVGALRAIAQLDLPLHVVGLASACENLPSGHAYKPGDLLRARNGKTIEVISTDAEGRLILADALCYAADYQPAAVVDLATLTGACVIALGENIAAGMFATDDTLAADLHQAGAGAGEKLWRMPLFPEYRNAIKSDVADITNHGGRYGGVGASAIFLKEFVSYPWAHLDIAGMSSINKDDGEQVKGGTGFGVRTLVEFARRRAG
jgi:leucyl aminopeptidase